MVNFIKENLLGSQKEFRNRFINPIQNGQCADSTMVDVRVMKKRAHILYEMLAGCVQVSLLASLQVCCELNHGQLRARFLQCAELSVLSSFQSAVCFIVVKIIESCSGVDE